jgi:hypothetical protein
MAMMIDADADADDVVLITVVVEENMVVAAITMNAHR